jgi:hypothetical protein
MAPQFKGDQELQKNKPPNITKVRYQISKKFFIYCSIAIRVQKWFVELQVALL